MGNLEIVQRIIKKSSLSAIHVSLLSKLFGIIFRLQGITQLLGTQLIGIKLNK